MTHQELESLILAYFEKDLDPQGQMRLAELLDGSSEARAIFQSYMQIEGIAFGLGQAGCLTDNSTPFPSAANSPVPALPPTKPIEPTHKIAPSQNGRRMMGLGLGGLIALSLVAWIAIYLVPGQQSHEQLASVGHISRIVAAEWISSAPDVGDEVSIGSFEIQSGLVEFEFHNGAIVILEGPARFDIHSAEQTFLHHGRVRTMVPPQAYGFTIDSANVQVIDLGTEFGMEVDDNGTAEVHVFDGEVEVFDRQDISTNYRTLLVAGEAIRRDTNGLQSEIDADVDAFVDQLTLASRAEAHLEEMKDKLSEALSQQSHVAKQLREAETTAKRSPQLQRLKKSSQKAKQRWNLRQDTPELKSRLAARDEAKARVEQLRRKLMLDDPTGKQLLEKLNQSTASLAESKQRLAEANKNREPIRKKLHRELRHHQHERKQAQSEFRSYHSKLRSKHPEIREVTQEFNQARKQLDNYLAQPTYNDLQKKAERKRKAFLAKQRQVLQDDKSIKRLREQLNNRRRQARRLRRDIQQLQQAIATQLAIQVDNDLNSSDIE
ncbi:MAG: FecR domain-containing protein [Pirellulaceae bacterium]|nr:FecR domain-containing protein [Pirellulaceae bacterium]